jgi:hypothetical protein
MEFLDGENEMDLPISYVLGALSIALLLVGWRILKPKKPREAKVLDLTAERKKLR